MDVFETHGEFFDAATGERRDAPTGPDALDALDAGSLEGRKSDIMVLYTDQGLAGSVHRRGDAHL